MSRKLSLLFFVATITLITACSSVTGPVRDDEEENDEFCSVVGGTHTRCEPTDSSSNG